MKPHWALDGKVAILRPRGDLYEESEAAALVDAALDLVAKGNRALLVDLGDIEVISSTGLSGFIRIAKAYREREGEVVLCNLSRRNHTLFEVVKLSFMFDVHESERAALVALKARLARSAEV